MPFEEEEMENIKNEIIEYSNRKIGDKLSEIAGVENIVELRNEFEKRIRSYFKTVET